MWNLIADNGITDFLSVGAGSDDSPFYLSHGLELRVEVYTTGFSRTGLIARRL